MSVHDLASIYCSYDSGPSRLPMYVPQIGIETWHVGRAFERSKSDVFAIEMVVSGKCEFMQNGRTHIVNAGEIYIIQMDGRHRYSAIGNEKMNKRFMSVHGSLLAEILLTSGLGETDVIRPSCPSRIENYYRSLTRIIKDKKKDYRFEMSSLVYAMLMELARENPSPIPYPIQSSLEYMELNFKRDLSLEEIAEHANLSIGHFSRMFREVMNDSPMKYLGTRKMQMAQRLLVYGNKPINNIAEMLGYSDSFNFSTRFKKYSGYSPRDYRNNAIKK